MVRKLVFRAFGGKMCFHVNFFFFFVKSIFMRFLQENILLNFYWKTCFHVSVFLEFLAGKLVFVFLAEEIDFTFLEKICVRFFDRKMCFRVFCGRTWLPIFGGKAAILRFYIKILFCIFCFLLNLVKMRVCNLEWETKIFDFD